MGGRKCVFIKIKKKAKETREKQLKIGLVFQQFNLFPQYDVLDNVVNY